MADMRIASPSGTGFIAVPGTFDGAAFVSDWRQKMILDGRAYHVTVGALTSPITGGGAGTVIDAEQPEAVVSVPTGTAILPFRVHVQTQPGLIAADADELEILLGVDRTQTINAGTSTAETIFNLRTDNPRSSNCSAFSAYTGDMTVPTSPTIGIELARRQKVGDVQGTAANAQYHEAELLYEPAVVPVLVGPCALLVYWAGTVAVPGFAQVEWIEIPSTWVTAHNVS